MTLHGNGFFILKTKSLADEDAAYEYRVAYSEEISKIFGKYDDSTYNWVANPAELWNAFRACFFTTSLTAAKSYAEKLSSLRGGQETECGILVINSFHKKTWDELINGY
jgi:hypothetical protein